MPRKASNREVAPMIRGAFKRAVKELEDGGTPLSTIIKNSLLEKPMDTLRAISSFCPKELEVNHNHSMKVEDMNDEQLEQLSSLAASIIGQQGDGEAAGSEGDASSVH